MTRRDWAGRWGQVLDGLLATLAFEGALLILIGGW